MADSSVSTDSGLTRSWYVIGALAVVSLVLGVTGYLKCGQSFWFALYHGLQLFVLSGPENNSCSEMNPFLWPALFLAPASTIGATVTLLWNKLSLQAHLAKAHRFKNHELVLGLGPLGAARVSGLLFDGKDVAVVEKDPTSMNIADFRDRGAVVAVGDAADLVLLERLGLKRARRVFVATGDDDRNMEIAQRIRQHVTGSRKRKHTLVCEIPYHDPRLCGYFMARQLMTQRDDGFRLEVLSLYERMVNQMLESIGFPPGDRPEHLVLIGDGSQLDAVVVQAARRWRDRMLEEGTKERLPIHLIAFHAKHQVARLKKFYPGLNEVCWLHDHPLRSPLAVIDTIPVSAPPGDHQPVRVIVCCRDETEGLRRALEIFPAARRILAPVHVWMSGEPGLAMLVRGEDEDTSSFRKLTPFGTVTQGAVSRQEDHEIDPWASPFEFLVRKVPAGKDRESALMRLGQHLGMVGLDLEPYYGKTQSSSPLIRPLEKEWLVSLEHGFSGDFYDALPNRLLKCRFRIVRRTYLVAVTGHRALSNSRAIASAIEKVFHTLADYLQSGCYRADEPALISCLAEGTDQLAADVAIEMGFGVRGVLPMKRPEYQAKLPAKARDNLDRLLGDRDDGPVPYRVVEGTASSPYAAASTALLEECDLLLAVWDGKDGHGSGGTAWVVREARSRGKPLIWINANNPGQVRWENMHHDLATIERLARASHETYLRHHEEGATDWDERVITVWEELTERHREIERCQARWFLDFLAKVELALVKRSQPAVEDARNGTLMEQLARALHESYRLYHPGLTGLEAEPPLKPWENLTDTQRELARDQALRHVSSLAHMGFAIVPRSAAGPVERDLLVEQLARAIHEQVRSQAEGHTGQSKPALVPWEDLPEGIREDNRSQVRYYGEALARIEIALVPLSHAGTPVTLNKEMIEQLASLEHERWLEDKFATGVRYGNIRDNSVKLHPNLMPWEYLDEITRDIDRRFFRDLTGNLQAAGLKLVGIPPGGSPGATGG